MRDPVPSAEARADESRADATTGADPWIVPEAERFRIAVLGLGLDDDVADALDRLADALEVVAPSHDEDIGLVRQAAADHRHFPRTSLRSAWICGALDAAVRTLSAGDPPGRGEVNAYQVALAEVTVATAAIDPAKPAKQQIPAIRTALNKMVGAIAIAVGSAPSNTREVQRFKQRNSAHRG